MHKIQFSSPIRRNEEINFALSDVGFEKLKPLWAVYYAGEIR